ncbi:hypothetical protein Q6348_07985 [Isoptericola sp. b441]|uniref:WYL domain-containing protein n=1 Tax=Actinotalea lenta TaxID=3064654 RepID=A0ABT9D8B9_9CELL|nr:hypothetical protein [Isoptericola sp. b441]MDO8107134.1 hypothetical protein [Isoptericola sp. b441]
MAHHLLLGASEPNWRLAATEDPEDVRARLSAGVETAAPIEVRVVPGDRLEETTVYVRPHLLPWWALVHLADPDERPNPPRRIR